MASHPTGDPQKDQQRRAEDRRRDAARRVVERSLRIEQQLNDRMFVTALNREIQVEARAQAERTLNARRAEQVRFRQGEIQRQRMRVLNQCEGKAGLALTDPTTRKCRGAFTPATNVNGGDWGVNETAEKKKPLTPRREEEEDEKAIAAPDADPAQREMTPREEPLPRFHGSPVYSPTRNVFVPRMQCGGVFVPTLGAQKNPTNLATESAATTKPLAFGTQSAAQRALAAALAREARRR